jgi:thioredoxin-dependent peroxiredoxin
MFGLFSKPLPVGSPAPPFLAPDEEGHVFVLNQHRNKYVVLVFYPGDDTPTCRQQLCELRDEWLRLRDRGVYIVGVNPQDAASHGAFKKKFDFPFPILVDGGQRVARLYKANGLIVKRTVYVIGKDGRILFAKRGKPIVDEILAAIPAEEPADTPGPKAGSHHGAG